MKTKKILLAAVLGTSILFVTACGKDKSIATIDGENITVMDFYNYPTTKQKNVQVLQKILVDRIFVKKYGNEVEQGKINEEYNTQMKLMGGKKKFTKQLKDVGYTPKSYKTTIKSNLAYQKGLEDHLTYTKKDYKKAWKSFHPGVVIKLIQVSSEKEAQEIKSTLDGGSDFIKIAQEKSTDKITREKGADISFDSTDTIIPNEVKAAAFKLKKGEISQVITVTDSSTYQQQFYIIKMEKQKNKGHNMKEYSKQLKESIQQTKMNDENYQKKVISEEFKNANVKIKDKEFEESFSMLLKNTEN